MQKTLPPHVIELARRVLAPSHGRPVDEGDADVAACLTRSYESLRVHLESLLGAAAVEALLRRSLHLVTREYPWLAAARVTPEAPLMGLDEALRAQEPSLARRVATCILGHLALLLITFIGQELSSTVFRRAWPHVAAADLWDWGDE